MEEILASIRRIIADDQPLPGAAAQEPVNEPIDVPMASEAALAEPHTPAVEAKLDAMPSEHGIVATPQFPTPKGTSGVMDTPHPLAPPAPEPEAAAAPEPQPAPTTALAPADPDPHEAALRAMHEEPDLRAAAVQAMHDHVYEAHVYEEQVDEEPVPETPVDKTPLHETPLHQPAAKEPPMSRDRPQEPASPGLFSAATSQSLAAAFNTLAISRLADNSEELRSLASGMLRPLLKDWLDENLPGLVESIIREEIDRMARRTR